MCQHTNSTPSIAPLLNTDWLKPKSTV